jgi:hypothetical protein
VRQVPHALAQDDFLDCGVGHQRLPGASGSSSSICWLFPARSMALARSR